MATYELYLDDPLGNRVGVVDQFHKLAWSRAENDAGAFALTFGAEHVNWRAFGVDYRLEVWRVLSTGVSRLVRVYFIRRIEREMSERGHELVTISGPDLNDLLARRIVAADAESAEATKTDYADDMIKAVVREQLGSLAAAARDITAYGFTVAPDRSLGPSLTKAFSRRNVLTTCQDIAQASLDLDTRLYFDIVSPSPSTMELRTYTEQRGMNRSNNRTPFSVERGQLAEAASTRDWLDEGNFVYAAGQGIETEREVVEVSNARAIAKSPLNRREILADGRNCATTDALTAFGRQQLTAHRARRKFTATMIDVPQARFQLDWDFGDLLTAEYDEEAFGCEVAAVKGTVTPDDERIEARLERFERLDYVR